MFDEKVGLTDDLTDIAQWLILKVGSSAVTLDSHENTIYNGSIKDNKKDNDTKKERS